MPTRSLFVATALTKYRKVDHDKMPKGLVGYKTTDTGTSSITTLTDLTGMSEIVDAPADRIWVVRGYCYRVSSTVNDDLAGFRIYEGSTMLAESRVDCGPTSSGNEGTHAFVTTAPFTPSAGSHTYKLAGIRAAGSGNIAFRAAADSLLTLEIHDLGPSF